LFLPTAFDCVLHFLRGRKYPSSFVCIQFTNNTLVSAKDPS
jgi:hypothetical protein